MQVAIIRCPVGLLPAAAMIHSAGQTPEEIKGVVAIRTTMPMVALGLRGAVATKMTMRSSLQISTERWIVLRSTQVDRIRMIIWLRWTGPGPIRQAGLLALQAWRTHGLWETLTRSCPAQSTLRRTAHNDRSLTERLARILRLLCRALWQRQIIALTIRCHLPANLLARSLHQFRIWSQLCQGLRAHLHRLVRQNPQFVRLLVERGRTSALSTQIRLFSGASRALQSGHLYGHKDVVAYPKIGYHGQQGQCLPTAGQDNEKSPAPRANLLLNLAMQRRAALTCPHLGTCINHHMISIMSSMGIAVAPSAV